MYPATFRFLGVELDVWNAALLLGVVAGYFVLVVTFRAYGGPTPRWLALRYLITVYIAAVSAQLLSYAADLQTSLAPPPSVSWFTYYFHPLHGTKTLYGALLSVPLSAWVITRHWRDLTYARALDAWTPATCVVVGAARIGCLLQGCCYGIRSDTYGVQFKPGSTVYFDQLDAHLIEEGAASLPVLPVQALCAIVLFALAAWAYSRIRQGRDAVFFTALASYSVARFLLETVRADPDRNAFGPLSTSQWIALAVVALYVVWLATTRRRTAEC